MKTKRSSKADAKSIDKPDDEAEFLSKYDAADYLAPLTTVDIAIFAIKDGLLHILLIRRNTHPGIDKWALPGGFVDVGRDRDITQVAHRKLVEKTGVVSPYLEQVCTTGNAQRDPRGWSITVLYFALIDFTVTDDCHLVGAEEAQWFWIGDAQNIGLTFDHNALLQKAVDRLRSRTRYTALPIRLMPPEFSLRHLQSVFEAVLGTEIEKKSFRRRVEDAGLVEPTGKMQATLRRPAVLYRATPVMNDWFTFPRQIDI